MNQSVALPNPAVEGVSTTLPFNPELYDAYFYHSDHLGSSNYISNNTGIVSQHTEYLPFGETFVDEHLNSHNTPFKFNAKEFDDETGNYYYGARYYNPKWSTWLSVDPLVEETMDAYGYCYQNPINFVDPTGLSPEGGGDENHSAKPKLNVVLVILFPNQTKNMEAKHKKEGFEGWQFIFAANIQEGAEKINSTYADGEIDNFILWAHGNSSEIAIGSDEPVENTSWSPLSMTAFSAFAKGGEEAENYLSEVEKADINAFKSITNKVKAGGSYIIGGCDIGSSDLFPTHLINALGLQNQNVFFNQSKGGFNFTNNPWSIKSANIKNNTNIVKHYFNGIRREDYSDLIINNNINNPIILKR